MFQSSCPYCGFSITLPAQTCPTCGLDLPAQFPVAGAGGPSPIPAPPLPPSAPPVQPANPPAQPLAPPQPLVPPLTLVADMSTAPQAVLPPLIPVLPLPSIMMPVKKKKYKLPKREAELDGLILSLTVQFEVLDQRTSFFSGFLDFFLDLFIPSSPPPSRSFPEAKPKLRVTMVRLRDNHGQQRDIRIEGDFKGAGLTVGDQLSLWGSYDRNGLFLMQKGFNHTSQAVVLTNRQRSSAWLSLLPPLAFLALVILATLILQIIVKSHH